MRTFAEKPKATKQARSTVRTKPHFGHSHEVNSILQLQRTVGNHATQGLLRSNTDERNAILTGTTSPHFGRDFSRITIHPPTAGAIQSKPAINTPGDKYEQEADRVAEHVMRIPESAVQRQTEDEKQIQTKAIASAIAPLVQRQPEPDEEEEVLPASDANKLGEEEQSSPFMESIPTKDAGELGEEEEEELIQPKSNTKATPQVTPRITHDIHFFNGTGQPLPASERAFFEPRFGRDFGDVRVHADYRAARTAKSINARAFTYGHNVVFGDGQYSPGSQSGRTLLAHELTHVVQQNGAIPKRRKTSGSPFSTLQVQASKTIQRDNKTVGSPYQMSKPRQYSRVTMVDYSKRRTRIYI